MKNAKLPKSSQRKKPHSGDADHQHDMWKEPYLFDLPAQVFLEPLVKRPAFPVWTENKAKLLERYLYYFVLVTKHGTYLDGFAGPQRPEKPGMWSVELVLESEPQWLKHFYLFDIDPEQISHLHTLQHMHAKRDIHIAEGDCNILLQNLLASGEIKQKEATFCLLDQRTFQCHWSTLEALAQYKTAGHKIELCYFLPNFWLHRTFAAQKNLEVLDAWWGGRDWETWRRLPSAERALYFVERIKREFGYISVKHWPIYRRPHGGSVMYYIIHATDHPVAPSLMSRAYAQAVKPKEPPAQLLLAFQELGFV